MTLDELLARLAAAGWATVRDLSGGMGGRQVVLHNGPADLEIAGDRGEFSLALRVAPMRRRIVPWVWAAYLDGTEPAGPDLTRDGETVLDRLPEMVAAVATDPAAEATLTDLGAAYMRRHHPH